MKYYSPPCAFRFSVGCVCFLSCVALAVGELGGGSPRHRAGERGRGRVTSAAISRATW